MRNTSLITLAGLALAVGCGGGGGGKGGAAFAGATVPSGSSNAPVVSASRDTAGYQFDAFFTNSAVGGAVTALGTAPNTTAVLAGIAPLGQLNLLDGAGVVREGQFVFDVSTIARHGAKTFAATSNANAPRSSTVWVRDENTAPASWMLVLDGTQRETALASFNNSLFVFTGEQDRGVGSVLIQANSAFTEIAQLTSAVPQVAAVHSSTLWVGSKAWSSTQGGAAKLHRSTTGTKWEEIPVPGIVSPGQVGRVSGIAIVGTGTKGVVFVTTQVTDRGDTKAGSLNFWDDKEGRLAVLAEFVDDAPTSIATCDSTVYVGTAKGKLFYYAGAPQGVQLIGGQTQPGQQAPTTGLLEEPSVPANGGITSLTEANGVLFVGARGLKGAVLYRRTPKSGTPVTPTPPTPPTPGVPAVTALNPATGVVGATVTIAGTSFSATAADNVVKFGNVTATVSAATATSITCTVPTGATTGMVTVTVKGVPATGTPTFTVTIPKTFLADVKPILAAQNCAGCHDQSHPVYKLGGTDAQNYAATAAKVATPAETSKILTKPTNENPHGGGLRFAKNSPEYNTILQWIKDGAKQ